MIEILYSQKVRDAAAMVKRIMASDKLIAQHTQRVRSQGKRIRIRIESCLTVTEMKQLQEGLIAKYGPEDKWSEVTVSSTSWSKRWFNNVRGTEIIFIHKPSGNPDDSHVHANLHP